MDAKCIYIVKDFCVARFLHIGTIEGTTLAKINLETSGIYSKLILASVVPSIVPICIYIIIWMNYNIIYIYHVHGCSYVRVCDFDSLQM